MKRFYSKVLAMGMVLCLLIGVLASCAQEPEHTHEFSSEYYYDEENHWKECTCDEKSEIGTHEGGEADCTEHAKCTVCGASYGELEAHGYTKQGYDEINHWRECVCGAKNNVNAHSYKLVNKDKDTHYYKCNCGATTEPETHEYCIVLHYNSTTHFLKCECGREEGAKKHELENLVCGCGYKAPGWDHVHQFDILRCDREGHWYECACKERAEKVAHSGGTASCTKLAECEICKVGYGETKPHEYNTVIISEDSHRYICSCTSALESVEHDFTNGACECGYELSEQGHVHNFNTLKYNENHHWYECDCKVSFTEEAHKGGNATCSSRAVCEICEQSYGDIGHKWNDGELTVPATVETTGTIIYTCTECGEEKNEIVAEGTVILTRADIERALVSVAWAYYMKDAKMQYDSIALSILDNHYGGTCRHTREVSPEFGTSDTTIFSVCTAYPTKVFLETLDRYIWEGKYSPNGVLTMWFWLAADNQSESNFKDYINDYETVKDPITDNDRDTALLRWADFEKYLEDEQNELPYAYSLGTFDSSSFVDWYKDGTLEYYKAEGEDTYSYYLDGEKITAAEAKALVLAYLTEQKDGEYVNLRPGDLLTEDTHTLIYIGNGYVLDCNGLKYNIETGVDDPEELGGISRSMKTIKKTLDNAVSDYIAIRPLDYYTKDYDGDPGNDIIKYQGEAIEITDATYSRLEYPAMEIDRTVDITPYGTAEQNGTLTYTVKVSNKTNEDNYIKWKRVTEKGYYGEDFSALVITETIPEGTVFVSASEGYTLEDGVLRWTVDIKYGDCAQINYTVKVVAEPGSTITNDGGTVAAIPSNSISNRVGYAKFDEAQLNTLTEISESDSSAWNTKYGTDLEFAEKLYADLGVTLDLPKVEEIIENLFTPTYFEKQISMTVYYLDKDVPIVMYTPAENVSDEYREVQKMIIDRYYGGYRFLAADVEKFAEVGIEEYDFPKELDKTILEFGLDYLEAGDIIVYATAKNRGNTDMTSELSSTRILVYAGNDTLIEMTSDGNAAVYSGAEAQTLLDSSFKSTNDIFFALRPSQVFDTALENS